MEPKGFAFIAHKESNLKPQVFEDIPYFIWDIRPQGYLGKIFIKQNPDLKLPERWEDWQESDLLKTLTIRGDDLVGNLVIGRESFERVQTREPELLKNSQRAKAYPKIARATLQGTFAGSSTGGEQPKFTVTLQNQAELRHTIVKFSPPVKTEAGRRWADLLFAEELALTVLREDGYAAASAEAFESDGLVFLEVTRFDRVGPKGRRGMLSLGAINDEYVGSRQSWTVAALRLQEIKKIKRKDAEAIVLLDCFGSLIANSDRHFGNLSLFWEFGAKDFGLAPIYDMLPMAYAPIQGSVVPRDYKMPITQFEHIECWALAKKLAATFWQRVADDKRVSGEFQRIASSNAKIIGGI